MTDIDERVVQFSITTTKLTAEVIARALKEVIRAGHHSVKDFKRDRKHKIEQKKHEPKTGKQTLDELNAQGKQTSMVPVEARQDLAALKKELKKYSVDFSVMKEGKENYQVFFKSQDAERFNVAFKKVVEKFDRSPEKDQVTPTPDQKQKATSKKDLDVQEKRVEEPLKTESKTVNQTEKVKDSKAALGKGAPLRDRLEKAKKEAAAFNQSVKKEQQLSRTKGITAKRGPER